MRSIPKSITGAVAIIAVAFCVSACDPKQGEVTEITETRPVTSKDDSLRLFASSAERLMPPNNDPIQAGSVPAAWTQAPSRQFRILNYTFGKSNSGEVYVSLVTGTLLENVNRWRGQFDMPPLSPAEFSDQESTPIAGGRGIWVRARGSYGGVGADAMPGYGLAGVLAMSGEQVLSVKMVGPEEDVDAALEDLKQFCADLKIRSAE